MNKLVWLFALVLIPLSTAELDLHLSDSLGTAQAEPKPVTQPQETPPSGVLTREDLRHALVHEKDCTALLEHARDEALATFGIAAMKDLLLKVSNQVSRPDADEIRRLQAKLNTPGIADDARLQSLDRLVATYNRAIAKAGILKASDSTDASEASSQALFAHPLYMSFDGAGWTALIHGVGGAEPARVGGIGRDVFLAANPDQTRYRVFFTRLESKQHADKETYDLISLSEFVKSRTPSACAAAAQHLDLASFDTVEGRL